MNIMSKKEWVDYIMNIVNNAPKEWRKGQAVFNYVDSEFGVARAVQFEDNIDCFYNDLLINEFLDKAYERYSNNF